MRISIMTLLPFIGTKLAFGSSPNLTNSVCDEPGWNNPFCSRLNPTEPDITQICSPEHSTWGASIIEGDNQWFAIASTMVDNNGLTCWPSTSTCSIWSAPTLKGPWSFESYIGTGNRVPWCHNAYGTIEYKLADPKNINSPKTAALAIYGLTQINKRTKAIGFVNFSDPPQAGICKPGTWAKRFPVSTQDQEMVIFFKELSTTSPVGIRQELTKILKSKTLVNNINGYNRNVYVNSEFESVNLKKRNPFLKVNSVNPAPLIDQKSNHGALYEKSGEYFRILFYRTGAKVGSKSREIVSSMYMRADQYPWDNGATFNKGATEQCSWHIEDPYCWLDLKNKIHCLVHDGRACGNWDACTAKFDVPDNIDIFKPINYCDIPRMVANKAVNNITADAGQRPSLFFSGDKPGAFIRGVVPAAKGPRTSCSLMLHPL